MRILNIEAYRRMQMVGSSLPVDQIEKLKEIDEYAYNMFLEKFGSIEKYIKEKNKLDSIMKKYYTHQKEMQLILPKSLIELYNLHDCKLISADINNNSVKVSIDSKGQYSNINYIDFYNVSTTNLNELNTEWWILYVELYKEDNLYNFEFLAQDINGDIKEFSAISENIITS
ncbi:MAG: DUF4085 domain-containing protein [Candidatus Izimaplasma sp.]|nr:DUF4085 domain-containing protein [Candidatus Izimaplasma bacterium]